ncbi:MAG: glycosyltransferase family 4 protein [Desulfamplus sp.]|nr:glycosyltransferase family 4 protein [Desulfamplus sp.]
MKSLTIMHTTCHTQWGGLEKRIYNECCWMEKKGHRIIIAAPSKTPLAEKALAKTNQGWLYIPMEFTAATAPGDFITLQKWFSRLTPDILNSHGNMDAKTALPSAWLAGGKKVGLRILSRHISSHVKPSLHNKLLYKNMCHHVFTTAKCTSENLVSTLGLDPGRVSTIPSGISPPVPLPDHDTARRNLALELGLEPESRFIGFAGRVSPDKGVESIIRAFLDIREEIPQYHLVIVGAGEESYLEKLDNIVESRKMDSTKRVHGRAKAKIRHSRDGHISSRRHNPSLKLRSRNVHMTGFKENIWRYIRAFDCKILASAIPFEGIPQALLEAMFAKCPVIASRSGGIPEIVIHGRTGVLFTPNNEDEIGERILDILNRKYDIPLMTDLAHNMVKENNTIDSMGEHILEMYDNAFTVLHGRKR